MKKILILVSLILVFISVTGCGTNQDDQSDTSRNGSSEHFGSLIPEGTSYSTSELSEFKRFLDTKGAVEYVSENGGKCLWSSCEEVRNYLSWVSERKTAPIIHVNNNTAEIKYIIVPAFGNASEFTLEEKNPESDSKQSICIKIIPLIGQEQQNELEELAKAKAFPEGYKEAVSGTLEDPRNKYCTCVYENSGETLRLTVYRHRDCLVSITSKQTEGTFVPNKYSSWFRIEEYTPRNNK